MRRCNFCGDGKPNDAFGNDRYSHDGMRKRCRVCEKLLNAMKYQVSIGRITKEERRIALNRYKCQKALARV